MRRSQSPPRRLRACVACAKARAQCRFQPSNVDRHVCDRCERLGRACEAQHGPALRRPRRVKNGESESFATGGSVASSSNHDAPPRGRRNDSETLPSICQSTPSSTSSPLLNDSTTHEAAHVLHLFRTKYHPNFPFIAINDEMPATELCQQQPTVFRCIMLVAAPLPINRVEAMKNEVLGYIGSKLLAEDSRSLDMLQGMMICLAWANLNSVCDQQITTLSYLALGLAHTLGITKIPLPLLQKMDKDKKAAEDLRKGGKADTHRMKLHFLEEQRAYLGLYYVLSINSVHFGRKNPLDGAYVPYCLDAIISANEYSTDSTLVFLVQFTQISEQIPSPNLSGRDVEAYASLVEGSHRSLRADLDRLRETIADEAQAPREPKYAEDAATRKAIFELEYYTLIARLSEPATHLSDIVALGGTASAHRSVWLRNCLDAVMSYFEIMLSLPPESLLYQSLAFPQQATFMLIMATRLCVNTARTKDWDVEKVKEELNMPILVEQLVEDMKRIDDCERRNARMFTEQFEIEVQDAEFEGKGYWGVMSDKMGSVGAWFEGMSESKGLREANGPEVDELLARVAGMEREVGSDGPGTSRDSTAWLGLLPMGNLGWSLDEV